MAPGRLPLVDLGLLLLAGVAAAAALVVVLKRDVLHSALALITVLLCLAGIYAGLGAWFVAAAQAVVYAGAIMVLFLFAIMVLESRREGEGPGAGGRLVRAGAWTAAGGLLAALLDGPGAPAPVVQLLPGLHEFARLLFSDYLLPFELVGMLLLVALIAVVVLAGPRAPGDAAGEPS